MSDLSTKYMGFDLKSPIIPSASPLMREVDNVKKMEDAGAGAVVLDSLFEEEINFEEDELNHFLEYGTEAFAESTTYFPQQEEYVMGTDLYLERIRKMKEAVDIPVIASMNGIDDGDWTKTAKLIQEAGADALELNIYILNTNFNVTSGEIEKLYFDILRNVKSQLSIPVAVKLGPYFSSFAWMAKKLSDEAGADALVLFNRFYQPDFDIFNLHVDSHLVLSNPNEMRLPMQWIAILYGNLKASLALTTGVHAHEDAIKAFMAGADVAMTTSALLENGIGHITKLLDGIKGWMLEHEYGSLSDMKGSLSLQKCPDPDAFERANYMKMLRSYTGR
ncbi:dihydroorotate dehydrogenase-like protein [candidate division KSB1 bacterium]